MAENKVFFIINKHSGTGFQDSVEGQIIDTCAQLKIEGTIEYTQQQGHGSILARQAVSEGFPFVFAMGGDGTVNEVARGLVHSSTALGILPTGSGNGLARHLQIPLKTSLALGLLDKYKIVAIDTFKINNHLSVNVSGIGFDAHVAGKFGKNGKRGLLGYGKLVIQEFMKFNEFHASVSLDGKKIDRNAFVLAIANSSQFGNNAQVSPHASVCDQLIDVCFIKKVPVFQVIGFVRKMFSGRLHHSAFVEIVQGKSIKIDFESPMPYHIDGESMDPVATFEIALSPASLKVIVPDTPGLKR